MWKKISICLKNFYSENKEKYEEINNKDEKINLTSCFLFNCVK